ncbi:hypothetical protein BCR44DRAFT_1428557, partial [Catenaria anguillulae PL171]
MSSLDAIMSDEHKSSLPPSSTGPAPVCHACGCRCGQTLVSHGQLATQSQIDHSQVLVLIVPESHSTCTGDGDSISNQVLALARETFGNAFIEPHQLHIKSLVDEDTSATHRAPQAEIDPATVPLPPSPFLTAAEFDDPVDCPDLGHENDNELPEASSPLTDSLHAQIVQAHDSDLKPSSNHQEEPAAKPSPASRLPEASPDMYRIILSNLVPTVTNDQIYSLTFPYSLLVRGATFYPPRPTEPGGPMARSVMFGFRDHNSATKLANWLIQGQAGGRLPELVAPFGFANISPVMRPVLPEPEPLVKDTAPSEQNGNAYSIDLDLAARTAKAGLPNGSSKQESQAPKSTTRRPIASIITDSDHRLQVFNLLATRSESDILSLIPEHIQLTAAVFQPPTMVGPNRQLKQSVTLGFANGADALACYHWIQNLLTNGMLADYLVPDTKICAAPPLQPKAIHPRPEPLPASALATAQFQSMAPTFPYPSHMSFQPQPQPQQQQLQAQSQPPPMWPYPPAFQNSVWAVPVNAVPLQPVGVYYQQPQASRPPTSPTYFSAAPSAAPSCVDKRHISHARLNQPVAFPLPPSSMSPASPQPADPMPPKSAPAPQTNNPLSALASASAPTSAPISPPITPTVTPVPRNPSLEPQPADPTPRAVDSVSGADEFGITIHGINPLASVSAVLGTVLDPLRGRVSPIRIQQTGVHPMLDTEDVQVEARGVRFVFASDDDAKLFVRHVFEASLDGELSEITAAGCRLKVV